MGRKLKWVLTLTLMPGVVLAQEEEAEKPWSNSASLSVVATDGNSEVLSWALSDKFTYNWSSSQLTVDGSALKTRTTTRTPVNVMGEAELRRERTTTAEEYALGARFRQRFYLGLFAYASARWYRNELSGIENRETVSLGLGYRIIDRPRMTLNGQIGGDWTNEEPTGQKSRDFLGAQATAEYQYKVTETATLNLDLEILESLDDTDDLRINSVLGVSAALSSVFALKVTYTVQFDNQPVVVVVPSAGAFPDARFTFERVDQRLGASLVMNL